MDSPFSRYWRAMSPEERGPNYHDLYTMMENPSLTYQQFMRREAPTLSHAAGAVNQLVPMMEEVYRAQRSGPDGYDDRFRCQWCGGHIRNVTSCPNCGGPP